jgi:putative endonuclease
MNGVEKGRRGEDLAAAFLLHQGYKILHRNWRMKTGEIDIIAEQLGTVVFCEVKSRTSLCYGSGAEAVNVQKQQRIIRTALLYMQHFHLFSQPCRFDVIEILMTSFENPSVHHIPNAFGR